MRGQLRLQSRNLRKKLDMEWVSISGFLPLAEHNTLKSMTVVVVVCFWIGMIVSDALPATSCPRKSGAICTEATSEDRGKHQACICQCTTLDKKKKKKRTIPEIGGDKNAVPSCDVRLAHAQSAQGKSEGWPCPAIASNAMTRIQTISCFSVREPGAALSPLAIHFECAQISVFC